MVLVSNIYAIPYSVHLLIFNKTQLKIDNIYNSKYLSANLHCNRMSYIQSRYNHVILRINQIKNDIEKQRTYINNIVLKSNEAEPGSEYRKALVLNYSFQVEILNKMKEKLKELEYRHKLLCNEHYILEKVYSGLMVVKNGKIKIPRSLACMFVVIMNSKR